MMDKNIILSALVSVLLFGCNSSSDSRSHYQEYRQKWQDAGTTSYRFNYKRNGFSPIRGVWEVQVSNSNVIHVTNTGEQNPHFEMTNETAPTINSLFNEIKDCIDNDSAVLDGLSFDVNAFIPVEYRCTYGSESYGFTVTQFQAL